MILLLALLGTIVSITSAVQAQLITGLVRRNPDDNSSDTEPEIAPNSLNEDELVFVDRDHQFNSIPQFILGAEYVKPANDDKDNPNYELDVTFSEDVILYLIIDNRIGDDNINTPPDLGSIMTWVTSPSFNFVDTDEDVGIDEYGDGTIDNRSSIFSMRAWAGTYTFLEQDDGGGRNMYSIAVREVPLKATDPNPPDGAQGVHYDDDVLSWIPGVTADWHWIYFGTNPVPGVDEFRYRWNVPVFYPDADPSTTREPNTTYYWRIDEEDSESTIYPGDIWSFTTAPRTAHNPNPPDGAQYVSPSGELTWSVGYKALLFDIFLGTDEEAVEDANFSSPEYLGMTHEPSLDFSYEPLNGGTTYYWRIDNIHLPPDFSVTKGPIWRFTTGTPNQGHITRDLWLDIEGADLDALKNHVNYPGNPSQSDTITEFRTVPNLDNYGGLIHGWLHVPLAGEYTFWIAADDTAELWLSSNENPGNAIRIAYVTDPVGYEEFDRIPCQKSEPIQLESGRYFIMALWKEDTGFDHCSVAWQGPGIPSREVIKRNYLSPSEFLWAWSPNPENGAMDVKRSVTLSWLSGSLATQHRIYFGTEEEAVGIATFDSPEYKGTQDVGIENYDPGMLAGGTSYCWRVDEVNALDPNHPRIGAVWRFTTADFISIDDFEGYTDYTPDRIFESWKDGFGYTNPPPGYPGNNTGSIVGYLVPPYTEQTIVHEGAQSMPYHFDLNKDGFLKYAEATHTLSYSRDWTEEGVEFLSLWFRGYPDYQGSFVEEPVGTYTMTASGKDIWTNSDQFHYAWKILHGAGSVSVRIDSIQDTSSWAKAGLMIRETLEPDSAFAGVYITPGNGCNFQAREFSGFNAISVAQQSNLQAPIWVRLERDYLDNFGAYYSSNGINWLPIGGIQQVNMKYDVYIGLGLTSHNSDVVCEAQFSNVMLLGAVSPAIFTDQDIGIISNDDAPMYVAVNDDNGASAIVYHPNPNATQINTWSEWKINLREFLDAGVDLTNVNDISLGFGNKYDPQPGGEGMMYIDDIRLATYAYTWGDVSEDGIINVIDVNLAARAIKGLFSLSDTQRFAADVSGDGCISICDVFLIAQYAVGLIQRFPIEDLLPTLRHIPICGCIPDFLDYGDVNEDGYVDPNDIKVIADCRTCTVALSDIQSLAADVNGDGWITGEDAEWIHQFIEKEIICFPVEYTGNSKDWIPICGYGFGDFNEDCRINTNDFARFALQWLNVDCGACGGADFTGDGNVKFDDLKRLLDNWSQSN